MSTWSRVKDLRDSLEIKSKMEEDRIESDMQSLSKKFQDTVKHFFDSFIEQLKQSLYENNDKLRKKIEAAERTLDKKIEQQGVGLTKFNLEKLYQDFNEVKSDPIKLENHLQKMVRRQAYTLENDPALSKFEDLIDDYFNLDDYFSTYKLNEEKLKKKFFKKGDQANKPATEYFIQHVLKIIDSSFASFTHFDAKSIESLKASSTKRGSSPSKTSTLKLTTPTKLSDTLNTQFNQIIREVDNLKKSFKTPESTLKLASDSKKSNKSTLRSVTFNPTGTVGPLGSVQRDQFTLSQNFDIKEAQIDGKTSNELQTVTNVTLRNFSSLDDNHRLLRGKNLNELSLQISE